AVGEGRGVDPAELAVVEPGGDHVVPIETRLPRGRPLGVTEDGRLVCAGVAACEAAGGFGTAEDLPRLPGPPTTAGPLLAVGSGLGVAGPGGPARFDQAFECVVGDVHRD